MGLDNQINFKFWRKGETQKHIIEVCYWRKYWNVRSEIMTEFEERFIKNPDGYSEYLIPCDNGIILRGIENILKKYSYIAYCDEHDNCPWNPAEQAYHNRQELNKLKFLTEFIKGQITLYEFFCAAQCWDNFYFKEEYFEIIESGEIEYEIEFIDSY